MADNSNEKNQSLDPVVRRMLDNFTLADEAESTNRKNGLAALKFRKGGDNQWDSNVLTLRKDDNKPSESYNQVPQFVHQVTNDMRQNMPQMKFLPGNEGSKEVAEKFEDLARSIQASSEGEVAADKAADSQVTIGWGYWRYLTDYEDAASFDKIIKSRWVPNPFVIYDDPNATEEDYSDRRFLIHVSDIRLDDFNSDYKTDEDGKKRKAYDSLDLTGIGNTQPKWAGDDTVRVAEYWELTNKKTKLYRVNGKITKTKPSGKCEERDVIIPKVTWYKCTALEVLEKQDWDGIYIPYVRVSGERLDIDGRIDFSGLVEHMMPAQRQYNYWTNTATELAALAPKAPFVVDVESIKGYEKFYDTANVKNHAYLPYRSYVGQKQFQAPQRVQSGADMSSALALVQSAQQNLYVTTGIYPPSLGQKSNESSGVAIRQRQHESDVSTFHFPDNLARAWRFAGRILADLIPKTYDGARVVRLLKEDKSTYEVTINKPFVNEETGKEENYDLTVGVYDVMVTTGPSFTTKRQESAESQIALAQTYPPLMEAAGDIIVGNMDWPGAEKIAERLKKLLPPALQDQPNMKNIPPEVQAQMQQMSQMLEQLQGIVQQQAQALEDKQADIKLKEADIAAKTQDMQIKGQSDQSKAELDHLKVELEAEKLAFEKEKFGAEYQLNTAKLNMDNTKMRLDAKAQANLNSDVLMTDPDYHEDGIPPMQAMINSITEVLNQGLAQVAQTTAQGSQAVVESNALVALANQQVATAIAAPKQVMRDPDTGLISGVINNIAV